MARSYRDVVVETIVDIEVFLRKLDLNIVNLAMLGEYSEFDVLLLDKCRLGLTMSIVDTGVAGIDLWCENEVRYLN